MDGMIEDISYRTGLECSTILDLLNHGWTLKEEENTPPTWSARSTQLSKRSRITRLGTTSG